MRTTEILRTSTPLGFRAMLARPRLTARTMSAVAAATGAAVAGVALERHHLRTLARDPNYARLNTPLGGHSLTVVSADGTELHAEAFGPADGHTVVLAHGWTEQLSFWGPVITRLTDRGQRVVAYDLRGHGRSGPAVENDYSLDRFGEDVAAVLDATVDVESTPPRTTVVGHSLGAMSIVAWAGAHDVEDRADAVALVNTGLGELVAGSLLVGELARWLNHPRVGRAVLGFAAPLVPFSSPVSQAVIRYAAFGPSATDGDVAFYERMLIDCPADVRAACGVALSDLDLWSAAAGLTVPTLVVAGDRDRLTPPEHGRRIAEMLPRSAGLVVLEETGHMSPLERPRELVDALGELIDGAASTAGVAAV
jgi:pimeloyl-ACP methyl ester carboxylesterase